MRPVVVLLIALLGCGKGSGKAGKAEHKPEQPRDVADTAKLVEVGQCETAVDKLKAFVSTHPEEKEAYLVLGDAWTCRAYAQVRSNGPVDGPALQQAAAAYQSVLKLAPGDVRALVSAGTVETLLKDPAARQHLEAAWKADAKNTAALNLYALAIKGADPSGEAADEHPGLKVLSDGYAHRKGPVTVDAKIPPVCTSDGCTKGVLVETVTIDGQAYPAGTMIDFKRETAKGLLFRDRVHPSKKKGRGWILTAAYTLSLNTTSASQTVVTKLPPPRPFPGDYIPMNGEEMKVLTAWDNAWGWYGKYESDVPGYLASLNPVEGDIVPGSVERTGELVYMGGKPQPGYAPYGSVFAPVSYEVFVNDERAVDPKLVASVTVPEPVAAVIVAATFLSGAEKRALLVGFLAPGTPLAIGASVRTYDVARSVIGIRNGQVTIILPMARREDGTAAEDTYVDGELAKSTVQWKAENRKY